MDAPWLIKANNSVARVFARFLGILGTQFGGSGKQKKIKNHNLEKRNKGIKDAPWLIKANYWVAIVRRLIEAHENITNVLRPNSDRNMAFVLFDSVCDELSISNSSDAVKSKKSQA